MKVCIVTFWWTQENYGQMLQLYALYEWLVSEGHSVVIIKYYPTSRRTNILQSIRNKSISQIINCFLISIKKTLSSYKLTRQRNVHPRHFDSFRKRYLKFSESEYHSIQDLLRNPPIADMYICGSDQIWNYLSPTLSGFEKLDVYTAQFGSECSKRISYAASFGFSGIDKVVASKLISNLSSFQGVSVREINARDVLMGLGAKDVRVVPDPTLLFKRNKYIELVNKNLDNKFNCPDVFVYLVQNKSVLALEDIIYSLKGNNLSYFATGANNVVNSELNFFPTLPEWLYVMSKTDTIITNSFHGCVFSILFQKNFYYYPLLPNKAGDKDSRIESFLDRLGIEGRMIADKDQLAEVISNPIKSIDWETVKIKQEEFVQLGKDFLTKHLGDPST